MLTSKAWSDYESSIDPGEETKLAHDVDVDTVAFGGVEAKLDEALRMAAHDTARHLIPGT